MSTKQPESLRLADALAYSDSSVASRAAAELRSQHARIAELEAELAGRAAPVLARALSEWHEGDGTVMWWASNASGWAGEPAWCGTPLDSDWPGYHTHWTPHPTPPTSVGKE